MEHFYASICYLIFYADQSRKLVQLIFVVFDQVLSGAYQACPTTSLSSDLLEGLSSFNSRLYSRLIFITAKDTEEEQLEKDTCLPEKSSIRSLVLSLLRLHRTCFLFGSELQGCVCDVPAQRSPLYSQGLRLLCGGLAV